VDSVPVSGQTRNQAGLMDERHPAHRWVDGRRTDGLVPIRSRTGTNRRPDRRSATATGPKGPGHSQRAGRTLCRSGSSLRARRDD
jgi:hypothetical protein